MRRRTPRLLGGAVEALATSLAPATPLARVQRVWRDAVGQAIALEASPAAERAGVLTVTCRSAAWAQELDLMSSDVCNRLNEALGEPLVRDLRCRAGGVG